MTWTAPKLQGVLFSKKQLIFYNDIKKSEYKCLQDNIMIFQILRDTSLEFYRLGFLHVADYS